MNFTNTTQSAVIDRILQEHNALRNKVRHIHNALDQPEPTPDEVEALLHEFLDALLVHFSHEEEDAGFFEEVTIRAPHLAGQAAKLRLEHRQMLHEVDELCRFAVAGSPSLVWWRELSSRCHLLFSRLMRHEHEENKLLQQVHQDDIGVYD